MTIKLSVELLNDKKMIAMLQDLADHKIETAIKSGVAYAARGGKVAISKGLSQGGLNLSAGRIKKDLKDPRFLRGGREAMVHASYNPITALSYKAKQTSRGLGVTFYKGERKIINRGFIAKGLPFARRGQSAYPLRVVHGPSIAAAYLNGSRSAEIKAQVERRMEEQLAKGIMRRLRSFTRM